jgi:hypothetical protein
VDDDAELCSLLGEFLQREGFSVDFCALRRLTSICWMVAIKTERPADPERGPACPIYRVARRVAGDEDLVLVSY